MKVLKIIGIVVVVVAVIAAITIALLPAHAHVERSIVIHAAPGQVFEELNSFETFTSWSPWARIDPNTKYEYTGAAAGVGAAMSWTSEHNEVGSGTQTIVEAEENKRIKNEMTFGGFEGKSYAEFNFTPEGENTKVTWTYDSDMSGIAKVFGVMMDGMLGPMMEEGLHSLKQVVESKPAPAKAAAADTTEQQP